VRAAATSEVHIVQHCGDRERFYKYTFVVRPFTQENAPPVLQEAGAPLVADALLSYVPIPHRSPPVRRALILLKRADQVISFANKPCVPNAHVTTAEVEGRRRVGATQVVDTAIVAATIA
jgi:hypothetical protein